jgi:hypothetical protein
LEAGKLIPGLNFLLQHNVNIKYAKHGGSVFMPVKGISFRRLLKAVITLPHANVVDVAEFIQEEDYVVFEYKGFHFEIHRLLTDYQMEQPSDCPMTIFNEVVRHLLNYPVPSPWWARTLRTALPSGA